MRLTRSGLIVRTISCVLIGGLATTAALYAHKGHGVIPWDGSWTHWFFEPLHGLAVLAGLCLLVAPFRRRRGAESLAPRRTVDRD